MGESGPGRPAFDPDAVAADLNRIFGLEVAAPAGGGRLRRAVRSMALPSVGRAGRRGRGLIPILAAGFLGLSAGALLMKPPQLGGGRAAGAADQGRPPGPTVTLAGSPVAASAGPLRPQSPPAAAARPERPPQRRRPSAEAVRKAKPRPIASRRAEPPPPCAGLLGDARARCLYPAVLDADRSLRRSYHAAVRAGAPHGALAAYRARWSWLRRDAREAPDRVIDQYSSMSRELERMAEEAALYGEGRS